MPSGMTSRQQLNEQTNMPPNSSGIVPETAITGGQELFPLTSCVQPENAIIALLC